MVVYVWKIFGISFYFGWFKWKRFFIIFRDIGSKIKVKIISILVLKVIFFIDFVLRKM